MEMDVEIAGNESPSLCASCGGACCRTIPGIAAPEDFLTHPDPAGYLAKLLESGKWLLMRHQGIPTGSGAEHLANEDRNAVIMYPRPATKGEAGLHEVSEEADECVFLGDVGCLLRFGERPRLCRELEPDVCFECESPWGKRDAAIAWHPHQSMVCEALKMIEQAIF